MPDRRLFGKLLGKLGDLFDDGIINGSNSFGKAVDFTIGVTRRENDDIAEKQKILRLINLSNKGTYKTRHEAQQVLDRHGDQDLVKWVRDNWTKQGV